MNNVPSYAIYHQNQLETIIFLYFQNGDQCSRADRNDLRANLTYPAEYLLENLKIQNNVIEAAWQSGVKRLLFVGSSCIYPKFAKTPISEESLLTGKFNVPLKYK